MDRDRDASGRPRNARPRDGLGRPADPEHPAVPAVPDDLSLDAGATLRLAQLLLDDGRPFQAHEVLESRWKSAPPAERDYWQGLAQAAVALTHLRRGNRSGARTVGRRARTRLLATSAVADGVPTEAVAVFLRSIESGQDHGLRVVEPG